MNDEFMVGFLAAARCICADWEDGRLDPARLKTLIAGLDHQAGFSEVRQDSPHPVSKSPP